jgi:hypothetical protein
MVRGLEPLLDGRAQPLGEFVSMLGIAPDQQHSNGLAGDAGDEILLPEEAAGNDADPAQHFFSDAGSEPFFGVRGMVEPYGDEREVIAESVRPVAFDCQNRVEKSTGPSTGQRIGNAGSRTAGTVGMSRKNFKASGPDQLNDRSPTFRRRTHVVVDRQFVERGAFEAQDKREELPYWKPLLIERARQLCELAGATGEPIVVDRVREQSQKLIQQPADVFAVAVVDRELDEGGKSVLRYAVGGAQQCKRYALSQIVSDAFMFHYSVARTQPESRL